MKFKISEGITLREYLDSLNSEESYDWMITSEERYSLDMLIYQVHPESWDFEDDEYEKLENEVLSQGTGFGNVLHPDQLEDIIENLKMQKPNYSDKELEAALNCYSHHDAFYEITHT